MKSRHINLVKQDKVYKKRQKVKDLLPISLIN